MLQRYDRLLSFLSRTKVIWILLVVMIASGFAIYPVNQSLDGRMLDLLSNQETAYQALMAWTAEQKTIHIWFTLIADSIYPLAYAGFLAGVATKFAGRFNRAAALPALFTLFADFLENGVHLLALNGHYSMLPLKDIITPTKFGLFQISALLALILGISTLVKHVLSRSKKSSRP